MGDPLGFLKKSEQAKKEQEEQKRLKQQEAQEQFKLIKELKHDHGGYDCGYEVDYEISPMYGGGFDQAQIPQEISKHQEQEILNLLF